LSYVLRVTAEAEDALVAFFEGLPADARREYAALAELDRRFGEDVGAERRESGEHGA
jgi:hypothetical protein